MKHLLTLAALVIATSCFGQEACPELWTACGEGTVWDEVSQTCVVANVSDTDFDGCVGINDFLVHLSNFGSGCGPEPAWACGDPLEYQGYDYETVQIGDQCWFAENLQSGNYADGVMIPSNLNSSDWESTTMGARAIYGEGLSPCFDNSPEGDACEDQYWSLNQYGQLYNWYAVNDSRGLCPNGWHVPTDNEWALMTSHLGSSYEAGSMIKTTYGWHSGGNGTNSSGFSGLPGGMRGETGDFGLAGLYGVWWSSSQATLSHAWYREVNYGNGQVFRSNHTVRRGYSVRCIKDSE